MDDLAWKRDKMRRQTQQASQAVASLYGGITAPVGEIAPAPKDTVTPLGATQPYQLTQADKTAPEQPFNDAMTAGLGEYIHGVGDVGDMISGPMLYAGRKVGKGINQILGGELPTQQVSDEAGLGSDIAAPFKRIADRAGGDLSEALNQRVGLTGTVIKEAIESGSLAADPNASLGQRAMGALGAAAGAGSVLLSGGVPTRVNPGKAVSGYVDRINTQRILGGQRPIPNPTLGGLLKPPSDIGDKSKLGMGLFFKGSAKTPDEYFTRSAEEIRKEIGNLAKSGEIHQYDEKVIESLLDADREKIAAALRDPNSNAALHGAIRDVYQLTKKETKADLKRLGADEVSNIRDTTAPASETRPSIEEVQARLTKQYGVSPDKIPNKVDPAEYNQAAQELGISPARLRRADAQIGKEMDYGSVGEELTKDVLAGKPAAMGSDLAKEAVELRKTLHPDSEQEIAALVKKLKSSSPDEVEEVAAAFNLRIKNKAHGIQEIGRALDQQMASIHRSLPIEAGAGGDTIADVAAISKLSAEKKAAALAKRGMTPAKQADEAVKDVLGGTPPKSAPKAAPEPPAAPKADFTPTEAGSRFTGQAASAGGEAFSGSTGASIGPSRMFTVRQGKNAGGYSGSTGQASEAVQAEAVSAVNASEPSQGSQLSYLERLQRDAPADPFAPQGEASFTDTATPDTPRINTGISISDYPGKYSNIGVPFGPQKAAKTFTQTVQNPGTTMRATMKVPGGRNYKGGTPITPAQNIGTATRVQPPGGRVPPTSRNAPTPWTRNPDIFNKEFGVVKGDNRVTSFFSSDNQMERLLRYGKIAKRNAGKNPASPVEADSLLALEEADARAKTVVKLSDQWYSEVGRAITEAEKRLVGSNIAGKRSRELLDLKGEVSHPANPNAIFTRMTAMMDDAARPAFANVQPINKVQGDYIDTVRTTMQYSGGKAAESGVVMSDAAGNQRFFDGGQDASVMLRNYNPDTLHRMATDTRFADEVFDVVLALPENAHINRADAHKMMQRLKARIDKGEAYEIERQIDLWPDQVVTQSFGKVPLNDFIHHVLPTRGYSGGLGSVIKNQLRRAAVVREFGTLGADANRFRNLIEGPSGLQSKIGRLGSGAEDEFKSLIAALSGNRQQAGFGALQDFAPTNAIGKGIKAFANFAGDIATSMAGIKSLGQPFEVAAEMPGGLLAKGTELVKVMADTAKGLIGQSAARLGIPGVRRLAPDYRSELAKAGLPVEDFVSSTLSLVPRFQGEINNLGKSQSAVMGVTDFLSAPGRILNDIVAANNDLNAAKSGVRQAEAYINLATGGKLKQSDLARLTNNSISNESIAWLKGLKGKNAADIDPVEVNEFAREIASNIVQRLQRRLANPAFNQKFINDPLLRDHVKFMNYQLTALRATEDAVKNIKAIWKSSASASDKAKSIGDIMGGVGTRLLGTAAGGAIAMYAANKLMERQESDLAKEGFIGRMLAGIGATNIFGTAGIAGDMVLGQASKAGFPVAKELRKYATRGGKEDRPGMPDELVFTGRAIENAVTAVSGLAGYAGGKAIQMAGGTMKKPPEKMLEAAAKASVGTLNKAIIKEATGIDLGSKKRVPFSGGTPGKPARVPFKGSPMQTKQRVPFR